MDTEFSYFLPCQNPCSSVFFKGTFLICCLSVPFLAEVITNDKNTLYSVPARLQVHPVLSRVILRIVLLGFVILTLHMRILRQRGHK